MAGNDEVPNGTSVIEIAPVEALAHSDAAFSTKITCEPACDLRGKILEIKDTEGKVLASSEIVSFDGTLNETGQIVVEAPAKAGKVSWEAVLPAHETDGVSYPETSSMLEVTVQPHPVHMTVWDVPYATNGGEFVHLKVGVKCGAGCHLAGATLHIHDADGHQIATADASAEPWEGTQGLYFADFSAKVPDAEGLYAWEARIPTSDETISHAEGSAKFNIRVVPPPEFEVSVEAISQETQSPVAGARVVMHPYRAETDENGFAKISAAKGGYRIFVSKAKYDPMSKTIELTEDVSTRVELVAEEPESNPDDDYV